jgi:2-polyprenyl-3-methyl-5-hydroxy-6-metoxy-1,4-benzoquinol methylase
VGPRWWRQWWEAIPDQGVHVPTDYNAIAKQYKRSKGAAFRVHTEVYSFMRLLGDVSDKSVLDLACGEGFYSRRVVQQGAGRVVGVDNSPAMIELAREAEHSEPLGVEYLVADVKGLDLGERFDLVVAAYLLNYASTPAELAEMCSAIARHLRPGCRFVTVNSNPDIGSRQVDYHKYGFERLVPADLREGSPYVFRNYQDGSSFDIINYQLDRATHDQAFRSVGLTGVRWVPSEISPDGEASFGAQYWGVFLRDPPIILLECHAT